MLELLLYYARINHAVKASIHIPQRHIHTVSITGYLTHIDYTPDIRWLQADPCLQSMSTPRTWGRAGWAVLC